MRKFFSLVAILFATTLATTTVVSCNKSNKATKLVGTTWVGSVTVNGTSSTITMNFKSENIVKLSGVAYLEDSIDEITLLSTYSVNGNTITMTGNFDDDEEDETVTAIIENDMIIFTNDGVTVILVKVS